MSQNEWVHIIAELFNPHHAKPSYTVFHSASKYGKCFNISTEKEDIKITQTSSQIFAEF